MTNKKDQMVEKEVLNQSEAFLNKNKKTILCVLCALIVIIAGSMLFKAYYSGPREDKASTALAKGQEYFNNEMFDKALNGDGAGYEGFVKITSDFSGTDAANLANLYACLSYANLDKWNEAVKYLDAYSPSNDAMVSPAAVAALGNAYAHLNDLDKAVSNLKKAASMADGEAIDGVNYSISPIFLLQAAQILESQNKTDEALKIYQDIKKKYVNSTLVQSQDIDKYIERASNK